MGLVTIDNLVPGMVPATDVRHRSGRLLLNAGTELTEKHIHIFRTWGIVEVDIEGKEEAVEYFASDDTIDPERWKAAEQEITPLFCHTDLSHPCIGQLLYLSILRRVRNGKL